MTIDLHAATLDLDRGVFSWAKLRRCGASRAEIDRAVRDGGLTKLRHGWYARGDADPVVAAAVKAGGVCSCVSALKLHGVWMPAGGTRVHTRARKSAHNRFGYRRFCHRHGRPLPESTAVDDVPTALAHALRCLDDESIVVVLDSLQNLNLMSYDQIEYLLRAAPKSTRLLLDRCGRAESGTETMVRLRLRAHNLDIQTQVEIPGVGRVDLLVGKRLIIEVDSIEFHLTPEQFEMDRERDRKAAALGYLTIRLTYNDVVLKWAATEAQIMAIVRAGKHLHPAPSRMIGTDSERPELSDEGEFHTSQSCESQERASRTA